MSGRNEDCKYNQEKNLLNRTTKTSEFCFSFLFVSCTTRIKSRALLSQASALPPSYPLSHQALFSLAWIKSNNELTEKSESIPTNNQSAIFVFGNSNQEWCESDTTRRSSAELQDLPTLAKQDGFKGIRILRRVWENRLKLLKGGVVLFEAWKATAFHPYLGPEECVTHVQIKYVNIVYFWWGGVNLCTMFQNSTFT